MKHLKIALTGIMAVSLTACHTAKKVVDNEAVTVNKESQAILDSTAFKKN